MRSVCLVQQGVFLYQTALEWKMIISNNSFLLYIASSQLRLDDRRGLYKSNPALVNSEYNMQKSLLTTTINYF